ncbi:RbsD/FucU domain-containing protein, partial [Mesorhizobium japonicum]|uniref:RbsD/FucU domain-containing protein n=1 Tax=Mesorhizobium japonicum TaxID=2066070 RepID=UPI003B5AEC32
MQSSKPFERNAMLKGISPLLNADVLQALRAMGHGDDLIIADTNFPSDSVARQT